MKASVDLVSCASAADVGVADADAAGCVVCAEAFADITRMATRVSKASAEFLVRWYLGNVCLQDGGGILERRARKLKME